jgi:putative ATP-dependent endonuclease of OLD family
MYISKVTLKNYRNFESACFLFNKGINTIIGENGSGKTNLFRAVRLLLDDSAYQFSYKLNEGDFTRSIGGWRGHWIIISIEFAEISKDEAIQALFIQGVGVMDEKDYVEKATYNLFFRPKSNIRFQLSELEEGDLEGLEKILSGISIQDNYETFFTGKSTVDFSDNDIYKELVGDFDKVKFNYDLDTSKYGIKIPHQLSVAKEISFTFIQALRDVVSDFHNNKKNPLLVLLTNKNGPVDKSEYEPIIDLVNKLNEEIGSLPDVVTIRDDIKETIRDAVGETYSPSSISIKSSLPTEADKLLQSLKLLIGEPGETHEGGIHELSLGGANIIFLTLKLLEYKYQKSKHTFANFLIIEEPEAHIHTHIQKTLFDNLEYGDTQIIYSTHSTHISEVSNVANMNILSREVNYAEVFQPANGLNKKGRTEIQRYLDATRSNLLFAKGVLLVEGDAEEILIPLMVKKVLGVSLDELGLSLINIRSTGFKNVAQLFDKDRIRRRCSIVTDLDAEICDTATLPSDSPNTATYKTKVKNSSLKGAARKLKLDAYSVPNIWIEPFYANYTFEVDFVEAGNAPEVIELVPSVYKDPATIKQSEVDLNSDEVSMFGKRVLTMATQEGKGWFAIMLGEHIFHLTIIPEYIIDAIVFAKGEFSESLISQIIKYRVNLLKLDNINDKGTLDFTSLIKASKDFEKNIIELEEVISEINSLIPKDQLASFLPKLL